MVDFNNTILSMGIRGLNKYFKHLASPRSIRQVNISELRGKTLVVDTSIYMYKFMEDGGGLLNNMFAFITQCFELNITLLFVFDGKPNLLKKEILMTRVKRKITASNKYSELEEEYDKNVDSMSVREKSLMKFKMGEYKKRSLRITMDDIHQVKLLMDSLNVYYCDAPEEADVVCSHYVEKGYAWACVSDDMDMFAYGCPRVIREWNIYKSHATVYDLHSITKDIKIPIQYLRSVLLLLGNDYCKESIHLETAIHWFREYYSSPDIINNSHQQTFYDWLLRKEHVTSLRITELLEISILYEMPITTTDERPLVKEKEGIIKWKQLRTLLEPRGFVFIE
jgi:5'-3' exonuclease